MKTLLALLLLVPTLNASAALVTPRDRLTCGYIGSHGGISTLCIVSTTTSLPSLILEGQELDLNSNEASIRLVAEAHGDAEPVLSARLAEEMEVDVEAVFNAVAELEASNSEVSAQNVLSNIK